MRRLTVVICRLSAPDPDGRSIAHAAGRSQAQGACAARYHRLDGRTCRAARGSLGQRLVLAASISLPARSSAFTTEQHRIQRQIVFGGAAAVDDAVTTAVLGLLAP